METVKIAEAFFQKIHSMNHTDLTDLINNQVGPDLTRFIQEYTLKVFQNDDIDLIKRQSSTMFILGYLLRGELESLNKNSSNTINHKTSNPCSQYSPDN